MAHISLREQKDGTRSYRVKWRDPDGAFRERTFRTKEEANRWRIDVEKELKDGNYHDDRKGSTTFREAAEEWLATKRRNKPRTTAEFRRILEARVHPKFGSRKLASITVKDCARFMDSLMADGLRPATVVKVYGLFSSVMAYSVRRRYVYDNPAVEVEMPDNNSAEVAEFQGRYLTPAEFEALVEAAQFFHPTYGLVVRLLGTTGMRMGELAGLNVGDVHILGERGTVTIARTYDARYGLSTPKTSRSNRTVTLTPAVVPLLSAYLAEHPRLGEADAPLFMGRVVGGLYMNDWIRMDPGTQPKSKHARTEPADTPRPFDPSKRFDAMAFYKRIWVRAVAMAKVAPFRIHDLRHTAASFMLSSGMPLAMVSRQLGHSSVSTTDLIYGGLLRDSFDSAVDAFGDWYASQPKAEAASVSPLGDRMTS